MLVDFHSHTLKSDGTATPLEIHAMMRARGVEIYAVTDHDSLEAYPELADVHGGPRRIVGIEINTTWKGDDVHILGYGIPAGPSPLQTELLRRRGERANRVVAMIERLREHGLPIDVRAVMDDAGDAASLGRPHIARTLLRAGVVDSIQDAFERYLHRGRPGFVEAERITPWDAVRMISEVGGVPILAHPGRLKDPAMVDELIGTGIVGIEVFYGTHTPSQTAAFRQAAEHYKLVMSAGADFHDVAWTPWGVGMQVEEADLMPFFSKIGVA